jgi:hypothetical protein
MTAGNWTPVGVPVDGRTLIINSGSDAIAGAATGLSNITMRVTEGFTGTIGSSSTYLDLDGPLLEFASGGTQAYITGTWTDIRISGGSNSPSFLDLAGNASTAITTLNCNRLAGTVTLNSSATCATITQTGTPSGIIDVKSGVGSLANVTISQGTLLLASNVSTKLEALGGRVVTSGTAAVTALDIDGNATVEHNASGTLGTLEIFDGLFTTRDNSNDSYTVTNATVHTLGKFHVDSVLNNGTFSNPVSFLGGQGRFPIGSTITLA